MVSHWKRGLFFRISKSHLFYLDFLNQLTFGQDLLVTYSTGLTQFRHQSSPSPLTARCFLDIYNVKYIVTVERIVKQFDWLKEDMASNGWRPLPEKNPCGNTTTCTTRHTSWNTTYGHSYVNKRGNRADKSGQRIGSSSVVTYVHERW